MHSSLYIIFCVYMKGPYPVVKQYMEVPKRTAGLDTQPGKRSGHDGDEILV